MRTMKAILLIVILVGVPGLAMTWSLAEKPQDVGDAARVPAQAPAKARERQNPVKPTTESIDYGKLLFSSQCTMCHGKGGAGDGDLVARLGYVMPDFTDPGLQKSRTDGELFYIIQSGHGKMPDHERYDEKVIWDLINYTRTFAREPA